MVKNKTSTPIGDSVSKSLISHRGDEIPDPKSTLQNRLHKQLASRLLQKSKSIEQAQQLIRKLLGEKYVLECTVRTKDEEICRLNNNASLLTQELAAVKADHLKALDEIKMLKIKARECDRKTELIDQKRELIHQVQKELVETDKLLVKEQLKNQCLEKIRINHHKWRTVAHTDPRCYELLQKTNYLQKQLQKKMILLQSKDTQLQQREELVNKLKAMLKRRPFNLVEEPQEQMMEYYRTIRFQKERIKILTAQVHMFESLISDKYKKLDNYK